MNDELPQFPVSIDSGDTTLSTNTEEEKQIHSTSNLNPSQFDTLLSKIKETQENLIFRINGYTKLNTICDTLQGELLKAKVIKSSLRNTPIGSHVAIKKANKKHISQKTAYRNGITYIVDENLQKETLILKRLTFDNIFPGNYIIKYIDEFESDTHFYLVMEYIENEINLKQFIQTAHKHIKECTLSIREYSKAIKYLMWQLTATIKCLHSVFHCAHLDICSENIMLRNAEFITQTNGKLKVNADIGIKIGDFGVAECFDMNINNSFQCDKHALTLDNWAILLPEISNNCIYDGRIADLWALGIIFYECLCGEPFYEWLALKTNALKEYLQTNNFRKYFTSDALSLLQHLLTMDSNNRYNSRQVMEHPWFRRYYRRYYNVIVAHYS